MSNYMNDETIKINRQMFRETVDRVLGHGWSREMRDELEDGFFGPRKPREWRVFVGIASGNLYPQYETGCWPDAIRVREVLDDK